MGETFFEFFPVPKFLDPPFAGLSISDSSVSFVSFSKRRNGRLSLGGFDRLEIPAGILVNGDISKPEELVKILTDFRKKNNLNFVKVNLPEEKAFLFRATIPKMGYQEAKEALQFKIEENVPLSANEAIFDFYIMSSGSEEQKVVVSVLPQKIAYDYLNVLNESGFTPISFEVESQVIAKAVVKRGEKSPLLVVNIEKDRIGLFAVEKGLVQFTSTVDLEKNFFESFDEYSKKQNNQKDAGKEESGIITIRTEEPGEGKALKEEIDKLLSYWSSFGSASNSAFKVEKIITCGDVVLEHNFKKYFSEHFQLPMEPANVWTNAFSLDENIPELTYEEALKYAPAIGLALPLSNTFSSKPKKIKQKKPKTVKSKK